MYSPGRFCCIMGLAEAFCMIGHYIANFVMTPPRLSFEDVRKADSDGGFSEAFEAYDKEWDRHAFSLGVKDCTIIGEYIINPKAAEGRKKVAVIAHGITANRLATVKYGKMFYELGYNLVIFDERYHGESKASFCTLGYMEPEDIKAVVSFAGGIFGQDCFLGLHGESMGAASCLKALDTLKPDFVVADCPFSDLDMLISDMARKKAWILGGPACKVAAKLTVKKAGMDYRNTKPIESVKTSDVPVCFMHGAGDSLIDCKHSKRMYEVCKNPLSELHLYADADHAFSIVKHPTEYFENLKEFLEKVENV